MGLRPRLPQLRGACATVEPSHVSNTHSLAVAHARLSIAVDVVADRVFVCGCVLVVVVVVVGVVVVVVVAVVRVMVVVSAVRCVCRQVLL